MHHFLNTAITLCHSIKNSSKKSYRMRPRVLVEKFIWLICSVMVKKYFYFHLVDRILSWSKVELIEYKLYNGNSKLNSLYSFIFMGKGGSKVLVDG